MKKKVGNRIATNT